MSTEELHCFSSNVTYGGSRVETKTSDACSSTIKSTLFPSNIYTHTYLHLYQHYRSSNPPENMQEHLCWTLHISHHYSRIGVQLSQTYACSIPCLFTFRCPQPGFIIGMSSIAESNMEKYKSDPKTSRIGLWIRHWAHACMLLLVSFTCLFFFFITTCSSWYKCNSLTRNWHFSNFTIL